ncbi:MAG: aminoacyl-tRNA hydrolase [Planctomycetes bacterium]|nr:aminoacyl-tRNA hydrolase [Planctomycetota bacterium]
MIVINERIALAAEEISWKFARSGGPGGQNVNKVASKAMLFWDLASSPGVPDDVKSRLRSLFPSRVTTAGAFLVSSQRFRDQERNRQDCLDKLRELLLQAAHQPRKRCPTRPSRSSREARLQDKKHRAARKSARRSRPPD